MYAIVLKISPVCFIVCNGMLPWPGCNEQALPVDIAFIYRLKNAVFVWPIK